MQLYNGFEYLKKILRGATSEQINLEEGRVSSLPPGFLMSDLEVFLQIILVATKEYTGRKTLEEVQYQACIPNFKSIEQHSDSNEVWVF